MTGTLIVIPARFASSRLPGKPLLAETGKPLIQHTYETAAAVRGAEVVVATDDDRIVEAVEGFGGTAVLTSAAHTTGSARVAEVAARTKADIVVNLQGDEPEVPVEDIRLLIETHMAAAAGPLPPFATTLACRFPDGADPDDPARVKAVLSEPGEDGVRRALWFSRSRLPFPRTGEGATPHLHVGLYAFSPLTLSAFARMAPTPYELAESLEQLRILERGGSIAAAIVPMAAAGIDTPGDYAAFVRRQESR